MTNLNTKINFYKDTIENIFKGINFYKKHNIINNNEHYNCIENLENILENINNISEENIINDMQNINNSLSTVIKNYGVYDFNYLLKICLDNDFILKSFSNSDILPKFTVIKQFLHPINYKIFTWNKKTKKTTCKIIQKNKIIDDKIIVEDTENLECFDLMRTTNNFNLRIYGIKVILHDYNNRTTLCINCIYNESFDNIKDFDYIINSKILLENFFNKNNVKNNISFKVSNWNNYCKNLNLKDYLIYNSEELYNKYIYINSQIYNIEQKTITNIVHDFIGSDLFNQRNTIVYLLLNNDRSEFMYIAYLLYDILSTDNNTNDSYDQKLLYDSLSWFMKKHFKDAMYRTIEYTSTLSNFDNNKIPLEQQICLMKACNTVKEKAMQKLKEVKAKSEDSGSKARQFLDGLLKIPFGIYKEEHVLKIKIEILDIFKNITDPLEEIVKNSNYNSNNNIKNFIEILNNKLCKEKYSTLEILNIVKHILLLYNENFNEIVNYVINITLDSNKKRVLIYLFNCINKICKTHDLKQMKMVNNNVNIKNSILEILNINSENTSFLKELLLTIDSINDSALVSYLINIEKYLNRIIKKNDTIIEYISSFNEILDKSIYGHRNAKIQIERVLGQWINGEKSGYCFGFEGPPGIGKTTLAKKGIANCLKDIDNISRPFSFIALGGSSNASTLDGHNYTYVGSTWGKIVDILIDKKCMNPIIFIDELDKVSKTEQGKEIIGILMHLIDQTQNDCFQDKYFSNIDLDLSKALFIFSYNDVDLIDKILLDRIHRIKFDNLDIDDKIIIVKKYILPELYEKFGINDVISINDDIIKYIIEIYTNESGVRKLKEVLYEIVSSINLDLLKISNNIEIPILVDKDKVNEILKEKRKMKHLKINKDSEVGIINGLWANTYGNSGILHIETKYFITNNLFELKLTGMQGDVMKESMNVAKTLVLELIDKDILNEKIKNIDKDKLQGIHIHIPEGATPKDGPSAGAAITTVLYSLLTGKKIKNDFAITGEICLQGKIGAIGSLDLKILGGIRAGVTNFIYPEDNEEDYLFFYNKYKNKGILNEINFYRVNNINEVLNLILL